MSKLEDRFSSDYFLGILIAFPLTYPSPPFYIFSFLAIGILSFRVFIEKVKIDILSASLLFISSLMLVVSSIIFNYETSAGSFTALLGGGIFFFIFVLSHYIRDCDLFIKGFIDGVFFLCLATIFLFFSLGAYKYGVRVFYVPEYRLWAEGFIPDWPNYIVFFFCCATLLSLQRDKAIGVHFFLFLLASILTTSRLFFICLALSMVIFAILKLSKKTILFTIMLVTFAYIYSDFSIGLDEQVVNRLIKSEDREGLFSVLIELWMARPLLGYGVISLNEIVAADYASFHNSYLEVLIKGGGIGFMLFIAFILRGAFMLYHSNIPRNDKYLMFIILFFFLFSSLFQNYLKHPHIMVLFSVLFYVLPNNSRRKRN